MNVETAKMKKHHFLEALAKVDWKHPSTHVFFAVQVIGVLWYVWFYYHHVFVEAWPLYNFALVHLMIWLKYRTGMRFVTVWRHRFFGHRSFKVAPRWRWILPLCALKCAADAQRGVGKWTKDHRQHHDHSDDELDKHSCLQHGKAWCHILWVVRKDDEPVDWNKIPDLANIPGLKWIENKQWIGILGEGALFSTVCAFLDMGGYAGGPSGFFWNFSFSLGAYLFAMTLLYHGTFLINSLMHLMGVQRYETGDESRNSIVCAFATSGEGWHNNHHEDYPTIAKKIAEREGRMHSEARGHWMPGGKFDRWFRRNAGWLCGKLGLVKAQAFFKHFDGGHRPLYWQAHTFFQVLLDSSGRHIWIGTKLGIFQ